jgi:hypothetical protein
MAQARVTTNHDEILQWAKARGGRPAAVRSTHSREDPGILRIEFPNAPNARDESLIEISWDEFFEKFDEAGLALLYEEKTASGQRSNFNKLIGREMAEARLHGESHASRHAKG